MSNEKLTLDLAQNIALKALNNPKFSYTYYDEAGWYASKAGDDQKLPREIWQAVEQINPAGHRPFEAKIPYNSGADQEIITIYPATLDAYAVDRAELLSALQSRQPLSNEQQIIVRLAVRLLELSTDDLHEAHLCQQILGEAAFAFLVG